MLRESSVVPSAADTSPMPVVMAPVLDQSVDAKLKQAQAALALAQKHLAATKVYATVAGRVAYVTAAIKLPVKEGASLVAVAVTPGSNERLVVPGSAQAWFVPQTAKPRPTIATLTWLYFFLAGFAGIVW